ncbi:MAG: hypothetical protein ACRCSI_11785, partial [Eubacterium aggregans]
HRRTMKRQRKVVAGKGSNPTREARTGRHKRESAVKGDASWPKTGYTRGKGEQDRLQEKKNRNIKTEKFPIIDGPRQESEKPEKEMQPAPPNSAQAAKNWLHPTWQITATDGQGRACAWAEKGGPQRHLPKVRGCGWEGHTEAGKKAFLMAVDGTALGLFDRCGDWGFFFDWTAIYLFIYPSSNWMWGNYFQFSNIQKKPKTAGLLKDKPRRQNQKAQRGIDRRKTAGVGKKLRQPCADTYSPRRKKPKHQTGPKKRRNGNSI